MAEQDLGTTYRHIAVRAAAMPDALAVTAPNRRPLNYQKLVEHIRISVATLNAAGMGSSDRVGLILPNGAELAVASIVIRSGMICVPLSTNLRFSEYQQLFDHLKISAVVVQPEHASEALRAARKSGIRVFELTVSPADEAGIFAFTGIARGNDEPVFTRSDDTAFMLQTSGTTGRPRASAVSHQLACRRLQNIGRALAITSADTYLNMMPLYHSTGQGMMCAMLMSGGTIYCAPAFDAQRFFEWLDDSSATWFTASPAMHQAIVSEASRYARIVARHRLRFVRSANAPLAENLCDQIAHTFRCPVIQAYGLTETGLLTCNPLPPRSAKPGSVGISVGPRIAIINSDGETVAAGEVGQIAVQAEGVVGAESLELLIDECKSGVHDEWFQTRDEGYLDSDGYLFVTGRRQDMINRGGQKVWPQEIESVLLKHPLVSEAAAFSVPHELLGEAVAAAVVIVGDGDTTSDELRTFCAEALAHYKVPINILRCNILPKDEVGKILRQRLREQYEHHFASSRNDVAKASYVAPRNPVEQQVASIWHKVLGIKHIGIYDNFFALGGDSLVAMRIVSDIRQSLHVELSIGTLFDAPSIAELAKSIGTFTVSAHSPDLQGFRTEIDNTHD